MPTERELFKRYFTGRSVPLRSADFIRKIMVMGYMSFHKWDEAAAWEEDNKGQEYPSHKLHSYSITETRVDEIEDKIIKTLEEYLDHVRPHGFWYGVGQGIVSSFLYSILLVVAVLIVLFSDIQVTELLGIDLSLQRESP